MFRLKNTFASLFFMVLAASVCPARSDTPAAEQSAHRLGLASRSPAAPFLDMPARADGALPRLLSQTGAFKEVRKLTPADGLMPYDIVVPFWSDGAEKLRWVFVPPGATIKYSPTGEWKFPPGTVFVKTFTFATNEQDLNSLRRLETRLLVCDADGGVYGAVYKWRADNSDADLLETNLTETLSIQTATGTRTQSWYYPSRADCLTCHTANAGHVLGVKARQLNRKFAYPSGVMENELRAWSRLGLFDTKVNESGLKQISTLARLDDPSRSLADRARSYLDANCANCHRPNGTVAGFDARYDTPLARQKLIDWPVLIDEGIDDARVIAPNDPWRSILYLRAGTTEAFKMPPLARNTVDARGLALLRQWIESMPGPPVLPPPVISPAGGNFTNTVEVTLNSDPGATIHYTTDGTAPTTGDPRYEKPLRLTGPTILRARAFKAGFAKSIIAQQIFLIGQ